jgi:hypothetical protein
MNLLKNVKLARVNDGEADSTGTYYSDIIDMEGFQGVVFIAKFEDVDNGAVLTLSAQQGASNSSGAMDDLSGNATHTASGADEADDDLLALDLYKPDEQYVRAKVVVATQAAELESIIAIRYGPAKSPTSQDSTVLDSDVLASPSES